MFILRWRKNALPYSLVFVGLVILFSLAGSSVAIAQDEPIYLKEVRAIDTNDFGLLNPAGLAFSFDANLFFVLEASSTTQANIATVTPFEELVTTDSVEVSLIDPINMAFDSLVNRLLLFDSASSELVEIKMGSDGHLEASPDAIIRYQVGPLGLQEPRGMTVNKANGYLFILDGAAQQIVRIEPDAEGGLDGASALAEGRVSWVDLTQIDLIDAQGLALNPNNGHLYLLDSADQRVYELTETGQLVAILQLPAFEFVDPQGLVFAFSGDATDDPLTINFYVADTGFSARQSIGQPLGRIMELSLPIVYVPGDASTIQEGIDLADEGDLVLVAPGIYQENIQIGGKSITLASQYHTTQAASFIDQTIIDGTGNSVITVDSSVGPETKIIGFTIRNGNDGISLSARLHILNNRFTGNSDAIDYEGGGGICRYNLFENNSDDAIDLDGPTDVTIEHNIIRNNGDDGIEVRLHAYSGPTLNIIIRHNIISTNDEDGIQLVDYPDLSDRVFLIERNVIEDNAMVGLGLMDNGVSSEDFRGASIPERIYLFNNTFVDNDYGLTGGDNLIALNNIFVGSSNIALKNMAGNSIAAYNLLWGNAVNHQTSNIDTATTIFEDPRLDASYQPMLGSSAIDSGTDFFSWNSEVVLDLQPDDYFGEAPDLGAYEYQVETEQIFLPIIWKQR